VAEEGREANRWGGETLNRHKGCLGLSQSCDEMGGSGDQGGEPVAQPPDRALGRENRPIQVAPTIGDWASIPVRAPVDKLRLADGEADARPGPFGLQPGILLL